MTYKGFKIKKVSKFNEPYYTDAKTGKKTQIPDGYKELATNWNLAYKNQKTYQGYIYDIPEKDVPENYNLPQTLSDIKADIDNYLSTKNQSVLKMMKWRDKAKVPVKESLVKKILS